MILSHNWLNDLLHTNITTLTETLTDTGLEVENTELYETIKGGLKHVVVGEVITCEQHPSNLSLS
jgi:phenylalanyl-tRNA synthetase beta chain